jgi:hypothetical protein
MTMENPKDELCVNKLLKEERDISNSSYAPIIIKTIVYFVLGGMATVSIAILTAKAWSYFIK